MAGGTKGRTTAEVMIAPVTTDCNLVAGRGACAEKWRTAVWVSVFVTMPTRLMVVNAVGCAVERENQNRGGCVRHSERGSNGRVRGSAASEGAI